MGFIELKRKKTEEWGDVGFALFWLNSVCLYMWLNKEHADFAQRDKKIFFSTARMLIKILKNN